jgi:transposase
MPQTRLPYPKEFREKIIQLAFNGRSVVDLAKEFEPSEQTIRNWIQQTYIDTGHRHDGLSSNEKQELSRLRKENRCLQQERDILAKAAAWFARDTGSIPPTSSNS